MSVFINGIKSSWFNFKRILEGNKIFHYLKIMTVQFTGTCPLTLELLMSMKPNDTNQSNISFLGEECGLCKKSVGSHTFTSTSAASAPPAASASQRPIASTFCLPFAEIPFSQQKKETDIERRKRALVASASATKTLCKKKKGKSASSEEKSSHFVFLTNDIVQDLNNLEEETLPVLRKDQEVLDCVAFGGTTNGLYINYCPYNYIYGGISDTVLFLAFFPIFFWCFFFFLGGK